jgi:hypothetical protein
MKIKTSELTGPALDLAVAKCEYGNDVEYIYAHTATRNAYSSDWSQGGPIIEREHICTTVEHSGVWIAYSMWNYADEKRFMCSGLTPLIAAMRCYVASKLGDTPEVPDELKA